MTLEVRDWLPPGAYSDAAVVTALTRAVDDWSGRWFARRKVAIESVRGVQSSCPAAPQCLQVSGRYASVQLPGRGKRALLEALLDVDLSQQVLAEGDRHVLDEMVQRVLDDFVAVIDSACDGPAARDGLSVRLALVVGSFELLAVSIPASSLVRAIKNTFPKGAPGAGRPKDRVVALAPTTVSVHAILGSSEVALNELQDLGIGDVLVLDRGLKEPVQLHIEGAERPLGRGTLCRTGEKIFIQL